MLGRVTARNEIMKTADHHLLAENAHLVGFGFQNFDARNDTARTTLPPRPAR